MDGVKRWEQEECLAHCFEDTWHRRAEAEKSHRPYCSACGMARELSRKLFGWDLHVHHLSYQHEGHELSHELIPVCMNCHKWIEKHKPRQFSRGDSFLTFNALIGELVWTLGSLAPGNYYKRLKTDCVSKEEAANKILFPNQTLADLLGSTPRERIN